MYQFDFICTYKLMESDEDQENLYRFQLLQAFDLEEWSDDIFNATINEIYALFLKSDDFAQILEKTRANECIDKFILKFNEDNSKNEIISDELYFSALFNYHTFDLFHRCIVDLYTENKIKPNHLNKLLDSLGATPGGTPPHPPLPN